MFETSPDIGALAVALAKAQAVMEGAKKDAENTGYKRGNQGTPYATLASVIDAIKAPLADNGIAYVQAPGEMTEGKLSITTVLMHGASGGWMRSTLTIPVVASTPQAVGSAITYARRYSLMAMLGIAAEDDDGNAGSGRDEPQRPAAPPVNWKKIAGELSIQARSIRNVDDLTAFTKSEDFIRFRREAGAIDEQLVNATIAIIQEHGKALRAAAEKQEQA
jgi:hypothetical protein